MDDADHAGAADTGHHTVASKRPQLVRHNPRRSLHGIQQLRMGVKILAPGGDFVGKLGNTVENGHFWSGDNSGSVLLTQSMASTLACFWPPIAMRQNLSAGSPAAQYQADLCKGRRSVVFAPRQAVFSKLLAA